MLDVYAYFSDNKTNGYKLAQFKKDWQALSDKDKDDLKKGVQDGTFNY